MTKAFMVLMLSVFLISSSSLVFADYISSATVNYDSRYYPEFYYETGGAEGHSGAYIQISVGVVGYNELSKVNIKAKHIDTDFEVTLVEGPQECVGGFPAGWNVDQYWGIRLKPADWMAGTWEITMKYTAFDQNDEETVEVNVRRFGFPPEPTGVQIGNDRIVWNSIGVPQAFGDDHIEYRIMHHVEYPDGVYCVDEAINITDESAVIPLNRIRQIIPGHWISGDLIRVENRIYRDNRFDRGVRYFYLR